jgi:menaquinone-dependent protoporphyrinogen oxidase
MRILVAYATGHGSTRGVAERIAARLGEAAELRAADQVDDVEAYDAVVFGSPVYNRVFAGVIDRHQWPFVSRQFFHALGGRLGDNRDWDDIDAWATKIAAALR